MSDAVDPSMNDETVGAVFAALDAARPDLAAGGLGVAASGGGDSIALLHLSALWAASRGVRLEAASVDHGLRAESAAEAAGAVAAAAALGVRGEALRWGEWTGAGNLQAEARAARRRLLSEWAARRGLSAVALGHTMDDQAETVLMRLGRGAGVDGLSAMRATTKMGGVLWLRPLLGLRRSRLRAWLTAQGVAWVEDPSNEDMRFERVRARGAMSVLRPLGVTAEGLAETAERMGEAREALDDGAARLAEEAASWGRCGELRLALAPLRAAPKELARRLLRAGLTRVAGAAFGPRGDGERRLLIDILGLRLGGGRSLHGCLIRPSGPLHAVIAREPAAAARAAVVTAAEAARREGGLWDGRFRLSLSSLAAAPALAAESAADLSVRPLGPDGATRLAALEGEGAWSPPIGWAEAPRAARLSTPALWRDGALAAAPVAGYGAGVLADFAPSAPWPARS